MHNSFITTVGKLVGAGEKVQPSPATCGTGNCNRLVSPTDIGGSTFTNIEINGTIGSSLYLVSGHWGTDKDSDTLDAIQRRGTIFRFSPTEKFDPD